MSFVMSEECNGMNEVMAIYKKMGLPLAEKPQADFDFLSQVRDGIELVTQHWDPIAGDRIRIVFKNGHQLSVIRGPHTYGGSDGLFEIAPLDSSGDWATYLFDKYNKSSNVLGYVTIERVRYYIEKIKRLSIGALRGIKRRAAKKNRLLNKRYNLSGDFY